MVTLFSGLSVLFVLMAAALSAWSSLVNLPVIGSAYGAIANLDPFYAALKRVAREALARELLRKRFQALLPPIM